MHGDALQRLLAPQRFANVEITESFPRKIHRFGLIETVAKQLHAFETELKKVRVEKNVEQSDLENHVDDVIKPERREREASVERTTHVDLLDEEIQADEVVAEKFARHATE